MGTPKTDDLDPLLRAARDLDPLEHARRLYNTDASPGDRLRAQVEVERLHVRRRLLDRARNALREMQETHEPGTEHRMLSVALVDMLAALDLVQQHDESIHSMKNMMAGIIEQGSEILALDATRRSIVMQLDTRGPHAMAIPTGTCPVCKGKGHENILAESSIPDVWKSCERCGGSGAFIEPLATVDAFASPEVEDVDELLAAYGDGPDALEQAHAEARGRMPPKPGE